MKRLIQALVGAVPLATFGALSLHAAPCRAEPPRHSACEVAYERAQVARVDGDLLSATDNLVTCAGVSCPDAMQTDCSRWLEEVRLSVPTVVFRAVDQQGVDVSGASVSIDGRPEVALNGRAISVNPGPHAVTVRAAGYAERSQQLQFVEGAKLRSAVIALTALAESATPPPASSPNSIGARAETKAPATTEAPAAGSGRRFGTTQWLASGVAAVGTLGLVYFGTTARSRDHDLDRCSPNCSKADVSAVKRDYLFANLSLGVGLAAVATGVVHYLTQDAEPPRKSQVTRLNVSVGPRFVQLQGVF